MNKHHYEQDLVYYYLCRKLDLLKCDTKYRIYINKYGVRFKKQLIRTVPKIVA